MLRTLRIGYRGRTDAVSKTEGSGLVVVLPIRADVIQLTEVCIGGPQPGIVVRIRRAADLPIPDRYDVVVRDGEFIERFPLDQASSRGDSAVWVAPMADDRPGNYSLEVSARGFRTWRKSDVRVARGGCGVTSQVVDVTLERDRR